MVKYYSYQIFLHYLFSTKIMRIFRFSFKKPFFKISINYLTQNLDSSSNIMLGYLFSEFSNQHFSFNIFF